MVLVWPLKELVSLWEQLRYNPQELKQLTLAASNELFFIWLLSSKYSTALSLDFFALADSIRMNIIAEDINGSPRTVDIIHQLSKGELLLETVECISNACDNSITAYIDNVDSSVIEWKSISLDRKHCLITKGLGLRITLQSSAH
jgi:hypothetical protein